MNTIIGKSIGLMREFAARFAARRETGPIATRDELAQFVSTRSAFVAQKKLYGYLKTRMGTRYPSMFEDDTFVTSVNIAKVHVFAACLSDMSVHAAGRVLAGAGRDFDPGALARYTFERGIADNEAAGHSDQEEAEWRREFAERLEATNWPNVAAGSDCFTRSPKALVRWAPIADELKRYDREIVENSIRFAWAEFTRDLRQRLDAPQIAAAWTKTEG